jgi:hypothetical protein
MVARACGERRVRMFYGQVRVTPLCHTVPAAHRFGSRSFHCLGVCACAYGGQDDTGLCVGVVDGEFSST